VKIRGKKPQQQPKKIILAQSQILEVFTHRKCQGGAAKGGGIGVCLKAWGWESLSQTIT
jgi:hypothetical protein